MGVNRPEELMALQKDIARIAVGAGAEQDRHSYKPHITLARIKKMLPGKIVESRLLPSLETEAAVMTADRFILYESVLSSTGAKHREVRVYTA